MRTLAAALIGVALLPASVGQPRREPRTLQADTVTLRDVRRAADSPVSADLADSPDTLVVERPFRARPGATAGVFVVGRDGVLLRRAVVTYGRASGALIQIVNGALPGDRLIVSDMSAWDAFDGLQLRYQRLLEAAATRSGRLTAKVLDSAAEALMKLTFVLVISVLAHLVVLVPPALASECGDTAGIAWVSGQGGTRGAWQIHGFVSIGSERVDARGVSTLPGSGDVFIAEGTTVSCADVDGNGIAGVISIEMQFRSVPSGRVLIAAIVPDAGEMDEGGLYGVTFRVDDMTLAGEVLLVPAAGVRAHYTTAGHCRNAGCTKFRTQA
jgi:hypothetical protein